MNTKNPIIHPFQWKVVRKLALHDGLKFNDIKPDNVDPKRFTYHLKKLVENNLVLHNQTSKLYSLTEQGKLLIAYYIELPSWGVVPLHSGILLYIKKEGKILTVKRDQAPFKDYIGLLYYPAQLESYLAYTAEGALSNLGLKGEATLPLIIEVLFKNKSNVVIRHACMFTYYIEEPEGEIPSKSYEGELSWLTPKELLKAKPAYDNTNDAVGFFENEYSQDKGITIISKTYSTEI